MIEPVINIATIVVIEILLPKLIACLLVITPAQASPPIQIDPSTEAVQQQGGERR